MRKGNIQSSGECMSSFMDDLAYEDGEEYEREVGERDCHSWDL